MGNIFKCCGKSGKVCVRVIAYVDIVLAMTVLMVWILFRGALTPNYYSPPLPPSEKEVKISKYMGTPKIVGIIACTAIFFVECCLTNIILSALKNKNAGLCDNWIKIRLVLLCVFVFGILYCLTGTSDHVFLYSAGSGGLGYILYRIYTLLVVKHFQNEVSPKDIRKFPIEIIPMHPIINTI